MKYTIDEQLEFVRDMIADADKEFPNAKDMFKSIEESLCVAKKFGEVMAANVEETKTEE